MNKVFAFIATIVVRNRGDQLDTQIFRQPSVKQINRAHNTANVETKPLSFEAKIGLIAGGCTCL